MEKGSERSTRWSASKRRYEWGRPGSLAAALRSLGIVEQTLHNWVKAERQGRLAGAEKKAVSAAQMEISRLRGELARVKMGRDILGKATAYCVLRKQPS